MPLSAVVVAGPSELEEQEYDVPQTPPTHVSVPVLKTTELIWQVPVSPIRRRGTLES